MLENAAEGTQTVQVETSQIDSAMKIVETVKILWTYTHLLTTQNDSKLTCSCLIPTEQPLHQCSDPTGEI